MAGRFVASFSVPWLFIDAWNGLVPKLQVVGVEKYAVLILLSLACSIILVLPPLSVHIAVRATNTRINIFFGDLFEQHSNIAIPVNEYFDSTLDGDHVSKRSVHGIFLERFYHGNSTLIDAEVDKSLIGVTSANVIRISGRSAKYEIGTTAVLQYKKYKALLVALCHTDIMTLKASANIPDLWQALDGLWQRARVASNGEPLTVPLIGGGMAGIGLPAEQLLQLIVLSIVDYSKRNAFTMDLNIVLNEQLITEIDLRRIVHQWR